jgi:hypothetical protein
MSQSMKRIKLIDILPSIFGALTVLSVVYTMQKHYGISLLIVFGGGSASMVTGLASLVIGKLKHTLGHIHILNALWVIVVASFLGWIVYSFYNINFTF